MQVLRRQRNKHIAKPNKLPLQQNESKQCTCAQHQSKDCWPQMLRTFCMAKHANAEAQNRLRQIRFAFLQNLPSLLRVRCDTPGNITIDQFNIKETQYYRSNVMRRKKKIHFDSRRQADKNWLIDHRQYMMVS